MEADDAEKEEFKAFELNKRPKEDNDDDPPQKQALSFPPITADQSCSRDDIKAFPSAQRIKFLLHKMEKMKSTLYFNKKSSVPSVNDEQPISDEASNGIIDSINTTFKENNYSITNLLDDFHDLKYGKGIDSDDALFDVASDYFKDITTESGNDIAQCPFFQRHYMDRGRRRRDDDHKEDEEDDLLMDTLSMIYCYFIHSHDTTRFTKEERDRIMKMAGSETWKSVTDAIAGDDGQQQSDDDEDSENGKESTKNALTMNMVTDMLNQKMKKGQSAVTDIEPMTERTSKEELIEFTMMAQTVGVDEVVIRERLKEYGNDRDRLIGDLIDVVYGDNAEESPLWNTLKMEEEDQSEIFRKILHEHFECVHLTTVNMLKVCGYLIGRIQTKRLEIDLKGLEDVVTSNGIDGRMFDKTDPVHYQNCGGFAKRFKAIPDCKLQHIRQMYNAVRKWKYVEVKVVVVEAKEDEKEEESNYNTENAPIVDQQSDSDQPDVYAIGKRFVFWESQKEHDDYIKAKYPNMKEEILQSPLVSRYFQGISGWNKLMESVNVLIRTKVALKVVSNGESEYLYGIQKGKEFDAKHLCALKLYTDFTKLCSAICSILRRGDPQEIGQIAHWVRTLIETVQCFGTPLTNSSTTYFRGVDKTFMFMMIDSRFNLPQSTTSSEIEAIKFADQGADGLVVKLGKSQSKRARKVMKFECEKFSCFPEEKETLFFGGDTELRIKGIMQWVGGKWKHYDKYMGAVDALNRLITRLSLEEHGIHNKPHAQRRMNLIIRDHLGSALSTKDSLIPEYIRDLVSHQILSREHIRLNFNEMTTGIPWMRYLLRSHTEHYFVNLTNIAILFKHSDIITFTVSDRYNFGESEWETVVKDLGPIYQMGLSMIFRFELSSDEDSVDDMHQMAMGYIHKLKSSWKCNRDGNTLIFEISANAKLIVQSASLRNGTEAFIAKLSDVLLWQKEDLEETKRKAAKENVRDDLKVVNVSQKNLTQLDKLQKHLMGRRQVQNKEINLMRTILQNDDYDSETMVLCEKLTDPNKTPWRQLRCKQYITQFLRGGSQNRRGMYSIQT